MRHGIVRNLFGISYLEANKFCQNVEKSGKGRWLCDLQDYLVKILGSPFHIEDFLQQSLSSYGDRVIGKVQQGFYLRWLEASLNEQADAIFLFVDKLMAMGSGVKVRVSFLYGLGQVFPFFLCGRLLHSGGQELSEGSKDRRIPQLLVLLFGA